MIPTRLPADWPDICRSVGIQRIHVDPGWQSDQRARLDRRFTPIGVAWHHDGIPPGHRTIERWVTEHTTGGRWGTTTYINCIWPDGTLIIHGCRWSVNTGLSVPAVVQLVRNGQPVPPYPHGPRGTSSTDTNDEFYGVVFHGGADSSGRLADTFTDAAMATAARLTAAFTAIGVPAHSHVEHRQLSPDRKPDPYWGATNIATIAAAQELQPPTGGFLTMLSDAEQRELLEKVRNLWNTFNEPNRYPFKLTEVIQSTASNAAEAAAGGGSGAAPSAIAKAVNDDAARRMKG